MPRQGGQGKGKPKKNDRSFGKALVKQRANASVFGIISDIKRESQISVLDNSALDDFIAMVHMDEEGVEVKRIRDPAELALQPTNPTRNQHAPTTNFAQFQLVIPRKPAWNYEMTAEEVDRNEKNAFLIWRRDIASMEERSNYTLKITPFEKNLEVWRQLWRVCERSNVVIQVVDGRNPLLFFTSDLRAYLKELSPPRPMILLINKADLLTEKQRMAWAAYFLSIGVGFIFYSAVSAQIEVDTLAAAAQHGEIKKGTRRMSDVDLDRLAVALLGSFASTATAAQHANNADDSEDDNEDELEDIEEGDENEDDDDADGAKESINDEEDEMEGLEEIHSDPGNSNNMPPSTTEEQPFHSPLTVSQASIMLTRRDLLGLFSRLAAPFLSQQTPQQAEYASQVGQDPHAMIGMVGYPNVGKSSVINTLLGVAKFSHNTLRVAVSSTPGKTKHFQTLHLSKQLLLCDCPGLVFPSFMRSAGEMLCAGVLPINQMRDASEPATIIAALVPQHMLDAAYGMKIERLLDPLDDPNRPPNSNELFAAYCKIKTYITAGTGRWDDFRACKELLRDFNDGRLLAVAMPPDIEDHWEAAFEDSDTVDEDLLDDIIAEEKRKQAWLKETESTMMQLNERIAMRLKAYNTLQEQKQQRQAAKQAAADAEAEAGEGGEILGEDGMMFDEDMISQMMMLQDGIDGPQYEFIADDSAQLTSTSTASQLQSTAEPVLGAGGGIKREHKRGKRWGKKSRKLRDKDPYADKTDLQGRSSGNSSKASLTAGFTNRSQMPGLSSSKALYKGPRSGSASVSASVVQL